MINKTIIYIQLTQLLLQGCPPRPGLTGGVGPLHRLHDDWGGRGVVGEGGAVHVHVELALPLPCVPPHVPPALTLAQPALGGEVSVADQVHVCSKSGVRTEYRAASAVSALAYSHAGGGGGTRLEWIKVLRPRGDIAGPILLASAVSVRG